MFHSPILFIVLFYFVFGCSDSQPELTRKEAPDVHLEYYSTIPLRESPYPDFKGVVRLSKKEAFNRNHYEFKYDSSFRLVSVTFKLRDIYINPNHTSNYFFTSSQQRFEYIGHKEIRTFYDRFGNQVDQRGAFSEVYVKNALDRYESLHFLDKDGNRIQNNWGIYEYLWEEQEDGSVVESRYDKNGKMVSIRPRFEFYKLRLYYHQNGMLALMQNIDNMGRLVENETGVAQDKLHFDKRGRWLGWTVLDSKNNIRRGNGPNVAKGVNVTDEHGYERSIRYQDIDESSIINSHGFWGSKRFYDEYGNYDYTQFLDKNGDPGINENSGYSIAKYHWSSDGLNRLRIDLFDVQELPVLHKTRGYASIKQEYDKLGRLIKTSFLGLDGELIDRTDNNISYITYEYNDRNEQERTSRFKKDGSKISIKK